ncbi:tetratricopeptide repeat protein [Devosia sp. SL43]|uniref:tetratricopeptide repeat protein n=1 Tax=Devosia sp. SL43 TaxID=2806348 RepID=UPI001F429411|nr:tetratricopeptide repeat protein [Devosia sp. SL43]UJW85138.1 tetratricopeptide repeat protein [Devosia sp. SL43]
MARAPKAVPATKAAAEQTRPRWWTRLSLPGVETYSNSLRTVVINLALLVVLAMALPLVAAQFARDQILIQSISIPGGLQATGLTPDVAANRLWDGIQQIDVEANSEKSSVNVLPEGKKVTFAIPDAGISVDSLVFYARQFFNLHETVVSGEFRCSDAACTPAGVSLRLRIYGAELKVIELPPMRSDTEAQYWRKAAAEVMAVLDPFTALAAEASAHPTNAATIARRLILTNHPDAEWAHNILGNIRRNAGDGEGAAAEYKAAVAIDDRFIIGWANLARVTSELATLKGDPTLHDEALTYADRVTELDSEGPKEPELRGDLAWERGEMDAARDFYLEAFRRDPLNESYQNKVAIMLYGANRFDESADMARAALEVNPGNETSLVVLAKYYRDRNDTENLNRIYRDAAEFQPENAAAQAEHAGVLMEQHDFAGALARIDQALLIDAKNLAYQLERAAALSRLERYQDALAQLDLAEALSPNNPEIVYRRGNNLTGLARYAEATVVYQQYLAMAPQGEHAFMAEAFIRVVEEEAAAAAKAEAAPD